MKVQWSTFYFLWVILPNNSKPVTMEQSKHELAVALKTELDANNELLASYRELQLQLDAVVAASKLQFNTVADFVDDIDKKIDISIEIEGEISRHQLWEEKPFGFSREG